MWCLCEAEDMALPSPRKLLSCLHIFCTNLNLSLNDGSGCCPALRTRPQSLLLSVSSPGLPTYTHSPLCPQELWRPRTMDALNRNQVGPACKTQAMVKVSGVRAKGQEGCCRGWVWLLYPPALGSSSLPFPRSQAY